MRNKALSLLGLARRAGRLEAGFDASASAAREKKARLLAAAEDVSEKTYKNLRYEGERAGIPTLRLAVSMEELGRACGVKAGVVALTDQGFAQALQKALEPAKRESKEESFL